MLNLGTKPIETDRLILRRFVKEDYEAMYNNWASDPEVTKYLMWPTHEKKEISASVTNEWVESYNRKDFYQWAIVFKEDNNNLVGAISVVDINEYVEKMHIGYCIGRKWWHKGITSEALRGVINFLFKEVKVKRIEARHDPRNPNSGGVMKKCGMKYEGTLRSSDWNNQGICDACYYSILKSEWENNVR
ncbi:MAG: GNAT family N-acetyltransferase [Clostridium sp.]|nr:GNAT family N-acetyltransferase [Clostridium sp.]